jgi:hypothetical protein
MRATRFIIGLVGLAVASLAAEAGAQPVALAEGEPFPDLVLPSIDDGAPRSLGELRGGKVVLHVFASW